VTEVVRLTLISHAMTDALAAGRFPADEPINDTGRHLVEAVAAFEFVGHTRQLTGPERRARQTAQLLGLQAATEPRLADLDCGRWRGEVLANIGPVDLEAWLDSLTDDALRTVAVTHPAVIRAAILLALDTQAKSFWRIDIAPLSQTVMHFRGGRWTLRL
jgi:broad specificity phosphatase PhoE